MAPATYLTPHQYATHEHKPGFSYAQYKLWVAKTRAARAQKRVPSPGSSYTDQFTALKSLLGAPNPTWKATSPADLAAQARASVQAQTDPIMRQITADAKARIAAGASATKDYTAFFANQLAGLVPQVQQTYANAEKNAANIGAGVTGLMAGQGEKVFNDISGALKDINAPQAAIDTEAGGAKGLALGAGAGLGGHALFDLSALNDEGAAQISLAQMQPGFAVGRGQGIFGDYASQVNNDTSGRLSDLTSSIPGLVQNVLDAENANELSKGQQRDQYHSALEQLGYNLLNDTQDRQQQKQIADAGLGYNRAQLAQDQAQFDRTQQQQLNEFLKGNDFTANQNQLDRKAAADKTAAELKTQQQGAIADARHSAAQFAASIATQTVEVPAYTDRNGNPIPGSTKTKKQTTVLPYATVYKRTMAEYAPDLRAAGVPETQIRKIIAAALLAAGVKPKKK